MNPRVLSFRTMADPTRPRWPATKTFADFSARKLPMPSPVPVSAIVGEMKESGRR